MFYPNLTFNPPVETSETLTYDFNTSVLVSAEKTERRKPKIITPLATFGLDTMILNPDEKEYIESFQQQVRQTKDSFLYLSKVNGYQSVLIDSSINSYFQSFTKGFGYLEPLTTQTYKLYREYVIFFSPSQFVTPGDAVTIAKTAMLTPFIELQDFTVFSNGILLPSFAYSYDQTTGTITTLNPDDDDIIEWTGYVYTPVRFESKELKFKRVGVDTFELSGVRLIEVRFDEFLWQLEVPYYTGDDFKGSTAPFLLPFEPNNSNEHMLPMLEKRQENGIEVINPFYEHGARKVTFEGNTIRNIEKDYLLTWFLAHKGKLNNFVYQGEFFRYSADNFSITSLDKSTIELNKSEDENCKNAFSYTGFSIEAGNYANLLFDKDTILLGILVPNDYTVDEIAEIEASYADLQTYVATTYYSQGGATGFSVAMNQQGDRNYIAYYNTLRQTPAYSGKRIVVLVWLTHASFDTVEFYYDSFDAVTIPRSFTKKDIEPTSVWQTDIDDYRANYEEGDQLIVLAAKQEVPIGDDPAYRRYQNLLDQFRNAASNLRPYTDNGYGFSTLEYLGLRLIPGLTSKTDVTDLLFSDDYSKRTWATVLQIFNNDLNIDEGLTTLDARIVLGNLTAFNGQYSILNQATKGKVNLSTDNISIKSVFNDAQVLTPNKLLSGVYTGSSFSVYAVDWLAPSFNIQAGEPLLVGVIGGITINENQFEFSVRSNSENLNRPISVKTSPKCRFEFGDSRCGFDLVANNLLNTVGVVSFDLGTRTIEIDTAIMSANHVLGSATITTGESRGARLTIASITSPTIFVYTGSLPQPLLVGEQIIIKGFCARDDNACKTQFNNFERFGNVPVGGFFIPSLDRILVP